MTVQKKVRAFEGLSAAQKDAIKEIVHDYARMSMNKHYTPRYWGMNRNTRDALISKGHLVADGIRWKLNPVYDDAIKVKATELREQLEFNALKQAEARAVRDKLRNKITTQLVVGYGLEKEMVDIILWESYTSDKCWRIDVHLLQEVKSLRDGSVNYKSYVKVITHSDGTHEINTTGTNLQFDEVIEYARLLSSAAKIVQDGILDGHKIDETF